MEISLEGKVALVTGAGPNIGSEADNAGPVPLVPVNSTPMPEDDSGA